MIRSFAAKDTQALYEDRLVPRFQAIERPARRKLLSLPRARTLGDLRVPPGNRLEALAGDRKGQHTIPINEQWRICFGWESRPCLRSRNRQLPLERACGPPGCSSPSLPGRSCARSSCGRWGSASTSWPATSGCPQPRQRHREWEARDHRRHRAPSARPTSGSRPSSGSTFQSDYDLRVLRRAARPPDHRPSPRPARREECPRTPSAALRPPPRRCVSVVCRTRPPAPCAGKSYYRARMIRPG